ncbi:MAG TPA: ubiquitin-like small modifier protein 1 [Dehalococcoidia bacterium]|nr:ubiquitin-like small modifier protein 1 [Dehalococcoidia bacterium]
MAVEVQIPAVLKKLTGGVKSVKGEGQTVRELLENLDREYPGIKKQLTSDEGELHRFVNVYLNDEDIRFLQQMETPVKDGDVVSILPAIAGG